METRRRGKWTTQSSRYCTIGREYKAEKGKGIGYELVVYLGHTWYTVKLFCRSFFLNVQDYLCICL